MLADQGCPVAVIPQNRSASRWALSVSEVLLLWRKEFRTPSLPVQAAPARVEPEWDSGTTL